eukprot:8502714-Alexandrium_andersonii.AAC.1
MLRPTSEASATSQSDHVQEYRGYRSCLMPRARGRGKGAASTRRPRQQVQKPWHRVPEVRVAIED